MVLPNNERTLGDLGDMNSALRLTRGRRFQVENHINFDVNAMRRFTGNDIIQARRIRSMRTVPTRTNIGGLLIDDSNRSWLDIWNELNRISQTRIPQCTRSNRRRCAA